MGGKKREIEIICGTNLIDAAYAVRDQVERKRVSGLRGGRVTIAKRKEKNECWIVIWFAYNRQQETPKKVRRRTGLVDEDERERDRRESADDLAYYKEKIL